MARVKNVLRYLRWRNVLFAVIALVSLGYAGWIFAPFVLPPEVVWEESIPREERKQVAAHLDRLKPGWDKGGVPFTWRDLKFRATDRFVARNRVRIGRVEGYLITGSTSDPFGGFPYEGVRQKAFGIRRERRLEVALVSAPTGPTPYPSWFLHPGTGLLRGHEWVMYLDPRGTELKCPSYDPEGSDFLFGWGLNH